MKLIGSSRGLILAQAGFRREVTGLLRRAAADGRGLIARYADGRGHIPERSERLLLTAVEGLLSDLFTGRDNRSAFGEDGVTALAPFPAALNRWIAFAVVEAVKQQEAWLRRHTPEDVFRFLRSGRRRIVISEIAAEDLFRPDPLADIDPERQWVPVHRWTDDRGYRLSDRIWRADIETRKKIDELLVRGLREGRGALDLASALEAYLVPGREGVRSLRPYGRRFMPGGASFDAMRLGRTEIARAFNQAAFISGYLNPYTEGVDWARSGSGDPACPICGAHATIGIAGERIRPPYAKNSASLPPGHPHCLCHVRWTVIDTPETVTARLRAMTAQARADLAINPADAQRFAGLLLGEALLKLLPQLERQLTQERLFF